MINEDVQGENAGTHRKDYDNDPITGRLSAADDEGSKGNSLVLNPPGEAAEVPVVHVDATRSN